MVKHRRHSDKQNEDSSQNETELQEKDISDEKDPLDFKSLILKYSDETRGYLARRAVFETRWNGDYDHLSRFGEWDHTQSPKPEIVSK